MPDVPNVPGVPALTSYSSFPFSLLFGDALSVIGTFFAPQWGVYIEGQPVIVPATIFGQTINPAVSALSAIAALVGFPNVVAVTGSVIEFDYSAESPISNYPQENGAFQSYNKVQLPYDVRMKIASGGGSAAARQAFFDTLEALRTSTALVDVVTPEHVYTDCNCFHIDYRRTAHSGVELIVADVWFKEVRIRSAVSFSNTQQPTDAGQQSIGNVQSQDLPGNVQQQFQNDFDLHEGSF